MSINKSSGSVTVRDPDTGDKANVTQRNDTTFGQHADTVITGLDNLSAKREVQTKVRGDGLTALVTDATVVVESTFGTVSQPFSFFTLVNTGLENDTITVFIKGTTFDSTIPDEDVPDYTKVFTVLASEVGEEDVLSKRIISELNIDNTFRQTVFLKASRATDRNVVIVRSDKFSQSGEAWERQFAGDFDITVTGSAIVSIGFDNLISRSIPVVINPDVDNGHRLGRFGISGNVTVTSSALSDLFVQEAQNAGSSAMNVNGSVTPVTFSIPAQATQLFIEDMIFDGQGNGIKFGNFLSQNTALTNGVLVTIKSDNIVTTFPLIKSTEAFKNKWAALSGDGANFRIDVQAGKDEMLAILNFPNPFILRETGAFGAGNDDYVRVLIQDNLSSSVSRFNFRVKGFEKDP